MGFWRNNRPYGRRRPKGPPPRLRPPITPRRERMNPIEHKIENTARYQNLQTMNSTKLQIDFHLICVLKLLPADKICGSRITHRLYTTTTHHVSRELHRRVYYSNQGPLLKRPTLPPYSPLIHHLFEDLMDTPQNEPTISSSSYSHPELFLKMALLLIFFTGLLSWCTCLTYQFSQKKGILNALMFLNALLSVGSFVIGDFPHHFDPQSWTQLLFSQLDNPIASSFTSSYPYLADYFPVYRLALIEGVLYSGITLLIYTLFHRHTFPHRFKRIDNTIHIIYQRHKYHINPHPTTLQQHNKPKRIKSNTNFSLLRFLSIYVQLLVFVRIPITIMTDNNNNSDLQPDRLDAILNAVTNVRTDLNLLSSRIDSLEQPTNNPTNNNNNVPPPNVLPTTNHDNVWGAATAPISPLGASTSNNTNGSTTNNGNVNNDPPPSIPSPPASVLPTNTDADGFTTFIGKRNTNNNNRGRIGGRGAGRGRGQGRGRGNIQPSSTTPVPRAPLSTVSNARVVVINWWTQNNKLQQAGGDVQDTSTASLAIHFQNAYERFNPNADGIITNVSEDKMKGTGGQKTVFSGTITIKSKKSTVTDDTMLNLLEQWYLFVNSKSHWTLTNDTLIPKFITVYRFAFPPTNSSRFAIVGSCANLPGNFVPQNDVVGTLLLTHKLIQDVEGTLEIPCAVLQNLCSHPWKTYQHLGLKHQNSALKSNNKDILLLNIAVASTIQAQPVADAFFQAATDPVTQTHKIIHVLGGLKVKFARCPKDSNALKSFYKALEQGALSNTNDHHVVKFLINPNAYDSDSDIITDIIATTPDCVGAIISAKSTRTRPSISIILTAGSNSVSKSNDFFREFAYNNVPGSAPEEKVPPPTEHAPVIDPLQDIQSTNIRKKKRRDDDWAALNEFADTTKDWNVVLNGRGGVYSACVSKWQTQHGAKYRVQSIPHNRHQGNFHTSEAAYAFLASYWDPKIFDQASLDNLLRRFVPLDFTNLDVIWFPKLLTPAVRKDKKAYILIEDNRPDINSTRAQCTVNDPSFDINIASTLFVKFGRKNCFAEYLRSRKYVPPNTPRDLPLHPPGMPQPTNTSNASPTGTSLHVDNDNNFNDELSQLSLKINEARANNNDVEDDDGEIIPATQVEVTTTGNNNAIKRTADDRSLQYEKEDSPKKSRQIDNNDDDVDMSESESDDESTILLLPNDDDDNNDHLKYGASQLASASSKSSLVIHAPPFTTVHDAEEFIAALFAKGQHLPDADDTIQITLCSYREWPHSILVVGTLLDINYVNSQLHDTLLLGQIFDHDLLTEADAQFITHVPRDETAEAHAKEATVLYCKKNCPADRLAELAALISSAVHTHEIFSIYATWGASPKDTGTTSRV